MRSLRLRLTEEAGTRRCILATLTLTMCFTVARGSLKWGLENEAFIVECPKTERSRYPVDWYNLKTNESIPTDRSKRVFASGERLKFLPANVSDSGMYACVIRSPTKNRTAYANVTIYKRPTDCHHPRYLMYSTISGSETNPKISCPKTYLYTWTAPLQWFKNCTALQGPRYRAHQSSLFIDNVGPDDAGHYTCQLTHSENGISYNVTATRLFLVKDKLGVSVFPVMLTPTHNGTKEVEIGKALNITCVACFGSGLQPKAGIRWQVNEINIENLDGARIQEEREQSESSSSHMTCLSTVLRITEVKEEDLSLKFDCVAWNYHGLLRRAVRLKKPIDHWSLYYIAAGCSVLLMLINVVVIILKVFWIDLSLLWRDITTSYKTLNDGKLYDAYVVYPRDRARGSEGPSSVEYFVHQILPDVLENMYGYNLCIYGRDLLPGEDAATAVEASIRKSRRHLIILAPHVPHGKEFAYEQEVALHCALIQSDSKVILIEMEAEGKASGLQAEGLQEALSHLVQVQGTIKWREDHTASKRALNSKFWKHVRYQMPVPSRCPQRGCRRGLRTQEQLCPSTLTFVPCHRPSTNAAS
ncbi:interleukin-1 receptor-like 1 isoform X2 [Octodon degus]|uniref:Interleukin-1 receptor-like 1 n=1 Tax=Octodon degus TaxID=10160 RepID=A0A6P6ELX6_OCTDE|nr:interleukin-1 receptor-like 1 isoform X2 [Octodon degus]